MSSTCLGDETYQRLMHPKPYLEEWEKGGMTEESRLKDSWECGTPHSKWEGEKVQFSAEQENTERKLNEIDELPARKRLTIKWEHCMLGKGYLYFGPCYRLYSDEEHKKCIGKAPNFAH